MNWIKKPVFLILVLLLSAGPVYADIGQDIRNGRPLVVIFQNATAAGMTLDAAVTEAIKANPERAGDIVAAAILLMPAMPRSACVSDNLEAENDGNWRSACEKNVIQAAILAGADPTVVTQAAAAGRISVTSPEPVEAGLGPARRTAPVQVPNGGAGGGGVASPS